VIRQAVWKAIQRVWPTLKSKVIYLWDTLLDCFVLIFAKLLIKTVSILPIIKRRVAMLILLWSTLHNWVILFLVLVIILLSSIVGSWQGVQDREQIRYQESIANYSTRISSLNSRLTVARLQYSDALQDKSTYIDMYNKSNNENVLLRTEKEDLVKRMSSIGEMMLFVRIQLDDSIKSASDYKDRYDNAMSDLNLLQDRQDALIKEYNKLEDEYNELEDKYNDLND